MTTVKEPVNLPLTHVWRQTLLSVKSHTGGVFLRQSSSTSLSLLHSILQKKKINFLCKVVETTPPPLGFLSVVDLALPLFLE